VAYSISGREAVAKLTPSAMMPHESELADLLRVLPFRVRLRWWRCPECGAFLRNDRMRVELCSPCEEKHEQEMRDAWEDTKEPLPVADRRITAKVVRLFWSKITRNGRGECWLWTGALCNGNPELASPGYTLMARRVSYELHHGPLIRSVRVVPICKNRRCVNPEHLQAGGRV